MSLRQNGCLWALNIQCSKPNTARPMTSHTMVKTSVGIIMTMIYEGKSGITLGPCAGSEWITGERKTRIRREGQPNPLFDNGSSDTGWDPTLEVPPYHEAQGSHRSVISGRRTGG